jgi:hypothetical protein
MVTCAHPSRQGRLLRRNKQWESGGEAVLTQDEDGEALKHGDDGVVGKRKKTRWLREEDEVEEDARSCSGSVNSVRRRTSPRGLHHYGQYGERRRGGARSPANLVTEFRNLPGCSSLKPFVEEMIEESAMAARKRKQAARVGGLIGGEKWGAGAREQVGAAAPFLPRKKNRVGWMGWFGSVG